MNINIAFRDNWKSKFTSIPGPVLLAISGGMDSMVMATLFLENGIDFAVAHCNFGLRGAESDEDETFVKQWCKDHNIRLFTNHFDTAASAEETGKSIQETARNLRYDWFNVIVATHRYNAICTAHHADDNAETMLMHLCRGTGIAGLHGIPERNGKIIRPLLFTIRQCIYDYAAQNNIAYREDSSNSKDDYLRNAVRHHILPIIEQWMPGAASRIGETSRRIGEAEEIYRRAIDREIRKLVEPRGKDFYIPIRLLRHRTPLATLLYEILQPFGFTPGQLPTALTLLDAESGKYICSQTHRLIRNRDFLILTSLAPPATDFIMIEDGAENIITDTAVFHFATLNGQPKDLIDDSATAYIDTAKLKAPLLLRRRKTGDYFYPLGMGMKKKKLSRYLTDLKIPAHEKEQLWVLESGNRIVWLAGYRLDERFKVTPATSDILKVKITGTGNAGATSAGGMKDRV